MSQLQAKANHSRICQLLIGKGGNAFRSVLQTKVNGSPPPSTLDSFLKANKKFLRNLRVVTPTQWNLLFPASGLPDSKDFDITLLTILLRNICGLPSPAAGWNVMPPASDTSISAEILRIKMFRNEAYAHLPCPEIDTIEFERLWQEISKPLIKLGIPQQEIDDLKEAPLTSEEETYIQELKEWKEFEDELISKMKDLGEEVGIVKKRITNVEDKVDFVKEKINDMSDSISHVENEVVKLRRTKEVKCSGIEKLARFAFKGKIEELCKKFQEGTRKWFFDRFKNWLDDENSRVMILTAGPGVGKSVLSAKICELYEESGLLAACHFCHFKTSDCRDPHKILQSLARQMCDNLDGFRDNLTETLSQEHSRDSLSGAFRVLLNNPLQDLDRADPMLIVVDALDESKTADKSEFLGLISEEFSQLPKWMKIFITSRPELQVGKKLKHLNPLEILPNDKHQEHDIRQFIKYCLPKVSMPCVESLVNKCEGSFLYAYYLVNELIKRLDIDQDIEVSYVSKGIAGFYEKQFERLKSELTSYDEQASKVGIFKSFVNVVAATMGPLPFKILFTCIGLSNLEYKIREAIVGIMSEILPVYHDCLTVFHKSLVDWLTLDGYEEHAYAADVADGYKRLWRACKKVYRDIDSLSSVSHFHITAVEKYALEHGCAYFEYSDDTEADYQWLVNVKVNYLKFKHLPVTFSEYDELKKVLWKQESRRNTRLYRDLFRLYIFMRYVPHTRDCEQNCCSYLQCLANKQFGLIDNYTNTCAEDAKKILDQTDTIWIDNTNTCADVAKKMLDQTDTIWLEHVTNEIDSSFKIISYALHSCRYHAVSSSADNKLLACILNTGEVEVYELKSLAVIFTLNVCEKEKLDWEEYDPQIVFSPDSSYFLLNSLKTCVSIRNQREVSFIPDGPAKIFCCSFSSCGTKLFSIEKESIKVWNVNTKELLAEGKELFHKTFNSFCFISVAESYIFVFHDENKDFHTLTVFDSTTLNIVEIKQALPESTRDDNSIQIISPPSIVHYCESFEFDEDTIWQLPSGKNIFCARKYCSKPFTWKGRQCVMSPIGTTSLVIYDYINRDVVQTFQISCFPSYDCVNYITHLGENNFLISLGSYVMSVLSLESSSEPFHFFDERLSSSHTFCSLSPDNLYVACSYGSPILKIMNVDNGETLQTVAPKQKPIACWWSKLYLWVVYEGLVVVKYISNKTEVQIVQTWSIGAPAIVLKFAEGVLVTQMDHKIFISRICGENLGPQQILRWKSAGYFNDVAISSDGCAVLIYRKNNPCEFELWEIGCDDRWELLSSGTLDHPVEHGCLTGEKNSRRFLMLSSCKTDYPCILSFFDLPNASLVTRYQLPMYLKNVKCIYVNSNLLIFYSHVRIYFICLSDGKVISSIHVGQVDDCFFIPSKRLLLLFIGSGIIEHFKIHNIDKYLPL